MREKDGRKLYVTGEAGMNTGLSYFKIKLCIFWDVITVSLQFHNPARLARKGFCEDSLPALNAKYCVYFYNRLIGFDSAHLPPNQEPNEFTWMFKYVHTPPSGCLTQVSLLFQFGKWLLRVAGPPGDGSWVGREAQRVV